MMTRVTLSVMLSVALLGLTACRQQSNANNQGEDVGTPTEAAAETSQLPADLFVEAAPEGARPVGELKADTEANGEVVVVGRVGGRVEPFVKGAAMFVLADSKMLSCDQKAMDGCQTPWDYCCESSDSLLANTATVQIVGDDGKPLAVDLPEVSKLAALLTVTVAGEVAQRDESGTLVINAKQIHVGSKPASQPAEAENPAG